MLVNCVSKCAISWCGHVLTLPFAIATLAFVFCAIDLGNLMMQQVDTWQVCGLGVLRYSVTLI